MIALPLDLTLQVAAYIIFAAGFGAGGLVCIAGAFIVKVMTK